MSRVWFISDLHFGHKGITNFQCPEDEEGWRVGDDYIENMYAIADNWRQSVGKRDWVWVLGDCAFNDEGVELLRSLPGFKKLVRGNHDNFLSTREWLTIFETVEGITRYKGYWLTHAPIHPAELRDKRNIHGHTHYYKMKHEGDGLWDRRYVNVCCEQIENTPILFEDIKNGAYWDMQMAHKRGERYASSLQRPYY